MNNDTSTGTVISDIARQYLSIGTLDLRHSDSLDFHDVGVAALRLALTKAYEAGLSAGKASR